MRTYIALVIALTLSLPAATADNPDTMLFFGEDGSCTAVGGPGLVNTTSDACGSAQSGGSGGPPLLPAEVAAFFRDEETWGPVKEYLDYVVGFDVAGQRVLCVALTDDGPKDCGSIVTAPPILA